MKCGEAQKKIWSGTDSEELTVHVKSCRECAAARKEWELLKSARPARKDPPASVEFAVRLAIASKAEEYRKTQVRRRRLWIPAAAAAVMACAVAGYWLVPQDEEAISAGGGTVQVVSSGRQPQAGNGSQNGNTAKWDVLEKDASLIALSLELENVTASMDLKASNDEVMLAALTQEFTR